MGARSQFRKWRDAAGLKQKWVAGQVGVSVRTLQNWESAKTFPNRTRFRVLMGVLGVRETEWHLAMGRLDAMDGAS